LLEQPPVPTFHRVFRLTNGGRILGVHGQKIWRNPILGSMVVDHDGWPTRAKQDIQIEVQSPHGGHGGVSRIKKRIGRNASAIRLLKDRAMLKAARYRCQSIPIDVDRVW